MNRFFRDTRELDFSPPRRALARFDQSEPVDLAEAEEAVVAFEAVDLDWLNVSPDFEGTGFEMRWRDHWRHLPERTKPDRDPFEHTPIYRFEISTKRGEQFFHEVEKYQFEPRWKMFERLPDGEFQVDVFGGLFAGPLTASYNVTEVPYEIQQRLDIAFDMQTWPTAEEGRIEDALRNATAADYLAVYDIGQGSANGLLDSSRIPRLYFDLGCGVYRNAHTTPAPLLYCWSAGPPIVLSHWDADHWAGANKDVNALAHTWIAPRQTIGPVHSGFANAILQAGGSILIWGSTSPATVTIGGSQRPMSISRCTGHGRNGSGLAVTVEDKHTNQSWLLTGDAGYHELQHPPPANLSAIVVPHHGADMGPKSHPPSPLSSATYRRLLYSFGDGNKHGRTSVQHPTSNAVTRHQQTGWRHGTWASVTTPGTAIAGQDVAATAVHQAGHRGGVIVGWSRQPNLSATPCGAVLGHPSNCSTSLDQN